MDSPHDEIFIRGIALPAHIGVPAEERRLIQVLEADVALRPRVSFSMMHDDIAQTIDYAAVADRVRAIAASRPRQLIETLVAEMAEALVSEFGATQVTVELRKRILPGVDHVAVRCTRELVA